MPSLEPDDALRVLVNDGVLTLGTLGPVCIYLYRDVMTLAHIARGRALHRALFKKHPEGLGVLIVYRTSRYLGDEMKEARGEFVTLMREANDLVKCVAVSIEQSGFVAAAIRASATGLTLLARPRFAIKYTATAHEGASWISAQLGPAAHGVTPARISAALAELEKLPVGSLTTP